MTSSAPSLFDDKWDIELTLDWLQALFLGRQREEEQRQAEAEKEKNEGGEGGASSPSPSSVDVKKSNRHQIRRVVLQFPDALLPVALGVQSRLSAGSTARGLDLEVR